MRKLFVLGIDAATWDVIDEGIEQGKMPFFEKLKNEGCYSELESTNPPRTCPAWPAFMTGKNPGKMGMYGFRRLRSDYNRSVQSFSDIEGEPFWDLMGKEGHACGVLNVPVTWPPEIEKGFLVSGLLTPSAGADSEDKFAVPERLQDRLLETDFLLEPNIDDFNENEFRQKAEEILSSRVNVTLELAEEEEWETLVSVIRVTDPFKHKAWRKGNKQEVVDFYENVDSEIKRMVEGVKEQEDVNILIVSDHGFGRIDDRLVRFNQLLKQEGYLKLEDTKTNFWMQKLPIDKIYNFITKFGVRNVRKYAPQKVLQARSAWNLDVDWENTKAIFNFVEETGLIYINREGRFEKGNVSDEEYEEVRDEIASKIKEVEDPKTGKKIVSELKYKEDIYSGENLDVAPDIIFKLKDGYRGRSNLGKLFTDMAEERQYAVHTPEGIFLAHGPDIKKGEELEKKSIYDIAPTALYMMDTPIPGDVDGNVLEEIFKKNSDIMQKDPKIRSDGISDIDF